MSNGQTSGSINLDMTGLAAAVVAALEPVLAQINTNTVRLAGLLASTALDEDAAVDVLTEHLPSGLPQARDIADHLTEHLAQAGYVLVAINGPALEAEVARAGVETELPAEVEELVHPAAAQAEREDAWFSDGRED